VPKPKKTYCACTYLVNANTANFQGPPLSRMIDHTTFPVDAKIQCLERKTILERTGKKSVKAYLFEEITYE